MPFLKLELTRKPKYEKSYGDFQGGQIKMSSDSDIIFAKVRDRFLQLISGSGADEKIDAYSTHLPSEIKTIMALNIIDEKLPALLQDLFLPQSELQSVMDSFKADLGSIKKELISINSTVNLELPQEQRAAAAPLAASTSSSFSMQKDSNTQLAHRRIETAKKKLQDNPKDAIALYDLALSNTSYNGKTPDQLYHAAATLGHAGACYKLARDYMGREDANFSKASSYVEFGLAEDANHTRFDTNEYNQAEHRRHLIGLRQVLAGMQSISDRDARQVEEARRMVENRDGLDEAIKTEIFPCVVSIETQAGDVGTGFYQHSEWLVSNAHVLSGPAALEGSTLTDFKNTPTSMVGSVRAFPRPDDEKSPDIIVIKGNLRSGGNNKSAQVMFFSNKDVVKASHFYVYFNHVSQTHEIKYLIPKSSPGSYPIMYACEDGIEPQPGCSGAPVIEAYISGIKESKLKWQFRTIGIVYARCINEQDGSKLACVIPVDPEFEQILEVLRAEDFAIRERQIVGVLKTSKLASSEIEEHLLAADKYVLLAYNAAKRFQSGNASYNLALLPGLEKLVRHAVNHVRDQARKAVETKREERDLSSFVYDGVKYYYAPDLHGNKHTEFSGKITKQHLQIWHNKHMAATFNPSITAKYEEILKNVIITLAIAQKAGCTSENYVRYPSPVGWDEGFDKKGEETNIIELYPDDDTGSHIRPKAESLLKQANIVQYTEYTLAASTSLSAPQAIEQTPTSSAAAAASSSSSSASVSPAIEQAPKPMQFTTPAIREEEQLEIARMRSGQEALVRGAPSLVAASNQTEDRTTEAIKKKSLQPQQQ